MIQSSAGDDRPPTTASQQASSVKRPETKRNIDLDFLRGVAILSVVLFHLDLPATHSAILIAIITPFKLMGGRAVDLFFVLSGFLVGGLLLKEFRDKGSVDSLRFLVRRGFKIWPAYYVYVLLNAIIPHHPLNTFLVANLLHLQNYLGSSLSQTWSLAIEEHFYLALAFFLTWASRRRLASIRLIQILGGFCLLALCLRINDVVHGRFDAAFRQSQNRMDSLLYGVILAVLFWHIPHVFEALTRRKWPLAIVSVALVALMAWLPAHPVFDHTLGYSLVAIGMVAFVALVFKHASSIHQWWPYRSIAWIGLYSYGIYLWHSVTREPSRWLLSRLPVSGDAPAWLTAACCQIFLAIFIGYLMSRAIEFPFLLLRDRLFPSKIKSRLEVDQVQAKFPEETFAGAQPR